jgi:hypothetical protein
LQGRLEAYLATKQMLLLLDNFEQVLAAAPAMAALLAAAPQLKLLVTSRASPLRKQRRRWSRRSASAWTVSNIHITALALMQLGEIAHASTNHTEAVALLKEALGCFRELGDTHRSARACSLLAQVALEQRRDAEARAMATECLGLARQLSSPELLVVCLEGLAGSAAGRGDWAWAAQLRYLCARREFGWP